MGMNTDTSCPFCGERRKAFLQKHGYNVNKMYFYEDEEFSISPDLSPLVDGHLLAIPKRHYCSIGALHDSRLLDKMINKCEKLLHTTDLLIFEHGAVVEGEGGASIDHAHIHIMPRPQSMSSDIIDKYILESGYVDVSKKRYCNQNVLRQWYEDKQSYIFYRISGAWFGYPVSNLPHQFLRLMLQPYCQLSYNWKETFTTNECRLNVERTIALVTETICK